MNRCVEVHNDSTSGDRGGGNSDSTEAPYNTSGQSTDTESLVTPSEVALYGSSQHYGDCQFAPYCFPFSEREDLINLAMPHNSAYYDPNLYRPSTNELTVRDSDFPHANLSSVHDDRVHYQSGVTPDIWSTLPQLISGQWVRGI
jgi:hypothetical protein